MNYGKSYLEKVFTTDSTVASRYYNTLRSQIIRYMITSTDDGTFYDLGLKYCEKNGLRAELTAELMKLADALNAASDNNSCAKTFMENIDSVSIFNENFTAFMTSGNPVLSRYMNDILNINDETIRKNIVNNLIRESEVAIYTTSMLSYAEYESVKVESIADSVVLLLATYSDKEDGSKIKVCILLYDIESKAINHDASLARKIINAAATFIDESRFYVPSAPLDENNDLLRLIINSSISGATEFDIYDSYENDIDSIDDEDDDSEEGYEDENDNVSNYIEYFCDYEEHDANEIQEILNNPILSDHDALYHRCLELRDKAIEYYEKYDDLDDIQYFRAKDLMNMGNYPLRLIYCYYVVNIVDCIDDLRYDSDDVDELIKCKQELHELNIPYTELLAVLGNELLKYNNFDYLDDYISTIAGEFDSDMEE